LRVLENTNGLRKLRNEDLSYLYSSPIIIIKVMKLRRVRWAEHVVRM